MSTSAPPRLARWLTRHPYVGVLANPHLRRLYLGLFLSSVGDGIAAVAVPWLALEVAGSVNRAFAVAAAGTAAFLPGIPVSLLAGLRRWRIGSRRILIVDAVLRGCLFALIGIFALLHHLGLGWYVLILAVSSVTRTLAAGARRTAIDELIRPEQRLAANSLLGTCLQLGLEVLGPVAGGLLIAGPGAGVALLVDAGSFAILFVLALTIPVAVRAMAPDDERAGPRLSILRSVPGMVLWLIAVTFVFNFLYGPIDVGLPIYVRHTLSAGPTLYGQLFTVFGVGSLVGGIAVASLRRQSVVRWVLVVAIIGWGGAALLLALATTPAMALLAFGLGGLLYGPSAAATVTAIQDATPVADVGPVISLWAAMAVGALPLGIALGGPLVAGLGTRGTFALCAALTLVLGIATLIRIVSARSPRPEPPQPGEPGPERSRPPASPR
jgi:MFS family permease